MTHPEEPDDFRFQSQQQDETVESFDREEILDSVIEKTQQVFSQDGLFAEFVEFVRTSRLPSKFSLENLTELVRFVFSKTNLRSLPVDQEECVDWVASCLYDDPVSNERAALLWSQIIEHIQAKG